jgi:hypothetical protein
VDFFGKTFKKITRFGGKKVMKSSRFLGKHLGRFAASFF